MNLKKKFQEEQNNITIDKASLTPDKKSFEVVEAETKDLLNRYFEENDVPFTWEAKILLDVVSHALYDQFATHDEDVSALWEEVNKLKGVEAGK